jgi:hypothetical protein
MLAPSGWLRSVSTRSCLVTRSTFGSSAFTGFLALAAPGVILRRDDAVDLALTFLDPALLAFRDFAMEGVDLVRLRWFAAPDLTLARPKAPQIAGRDWNQNQIQVSRDKRREEHKQPQDRAHESIGPCH